MTRIPAIIIVFTLTAPLLADTITMKPAVRLDVDATRVTLADVATLEGPRVESLSGLVLREAPDEAVAIDVREVRRILDEHGVHWGKVHLSGQRTIVRPRSSTDASSPRAMAAVSLTAASTERDDTIDATETPQEHGPPVTGIIDEPTLRGAVARATVRALRIDPAQLTLAMTCDDAEALDASAETWRFELEPLDGLINDHFDMSVRAWRDGRAERRWIVRVQPRHHTDVQVLTRDVPRGRMLTADDFRTEQQWLPLPVAAAAATAEAVLGRAMSARVRTGTVIRSAHLQRDELIRRGEPVMVRCVVGGLVIAVKAEARSAGALGDQIELRKVGERETFNAVVTGRGEAVVELGRRNQTTQRRNLEA